MSSTCGGTGRSIPNTVSIGETIDLLIIAVIGGIGHLEGAWLGALVYVAANNYLRDLPFADRIGLTEARFNTVVGLLVLAIVVLSPDGLMGLIERARDRVRRRTGRRRSDRAIRHRNAGGVAQHIVTAAQTWLEQWRFVASTQKEGGLTECPRIKSLARE